MRVLPVVVVVVLATLLVLQLVAADQSSSGSAPPEPPSGSGGSGGAPGGSGGNGSAPGGFNGTNGDPGNNGGSGAPGNGTNGAGGSNAGGGSSSSSRTYVSYASVMAVSTSGNVASGLGLDTSAADTSALIVRSGGSLSVSNSIFINSGDTGSNDDSSFYGRNAVVMADTVGKLYMKNCTVIGKGTGANGVFSTNQGSEVIFEDGFIHCYKDLGHGVDSTYLGNLTIKNVNIVTEGQHGACLSTDRGGGYVQVYGGWMRSSARSSPGIYSTGDITVYDADIVATGCEVATIEGRNTIYAVNTNMTGACMAVKIYCSTSGDATAGPATYTQIGGKLFTTADAGSACMDSYGSGYLFVVDGTNNQAATINLNGVATSAPGGVVLYVLNSATVIMNANAQTLAGSFVSDSSSTTTVNLKSASAAVGAATLVAMTVDSTSSWSVPSASTLTSLTAQGSLVLAAGATITVTGTATLGGSLTVGLTSSSPSAGTSFLIAATSLSGTFSSVTLSPSLASGTTYTLSYKSGGVFLTVCSGSTVGSCTPDYSNINNLPSSSTGSSNSTNSTNAHSGALSANGCSFGFAVLAMVAAAAMRFFF